MTEQAPQVEGQAQAPETQGQAEQSVWYDSAPDEIKGYIQNKGWDDPLKAVNSYQELEKFRGADEKSLIKLPKDMEAEGAMDEIYNRLGRPESADKYSFEFPDGVSVDEARFNMFKEVAHKIGLSQKQVEALTKADLEYYQSVEQGIIKDNEGIKAQQEAQYKALKKEWGANADEREELARRGLRKVLPSDGNADELINKIEQAIGTATTLKIFANVGDRLAREDRVPDSSGDRPFGYTREQAAADRVSLMNELKGSPERLASYNKGVGKDYDKMMRLNKLIAAA